MNENMSPNGRQAIPTPPNICIYRKRVNILIIGKQKDRKQNDLALKQANLIIFDTLCCREH